MEKRHRRFLELAILDVLIIVSTLWFGVYYVNNFNCFNYDGIWWVLLVYVGITFTFFTLLSLYSMLLDHVGMNEGGKIIVGVIASNLLLFFILKFSTFNSFQIQLIVFVAPLQILLMVGTRFSKRIKKVLFSLNPTKKDKYIKTLIIGAGSAGKLAYDEILRNASLNNLVVGFVDDDVDIMGSKLNGVKVYGPIDNIHKLIEKLDIQEVIIAISALTKSRLSDLVEMVSKSPVKIKRLPLTIEEDFSETKKIVEVKIEDLLDRGVVSLDNQGLFTFLADKVVLVTGGGGSIGSELCEQIINFNPSKLIVFDIYENTTYAVQRKLTKKIRNANLNIELFVLIGSVYNYARLESIFQLYHPNIVFHAAAYKHVPLMEDSAVEAVRTNVIGTYNLSKLCDIYKVEKMILVSSDKAVRPTNIMGATKAVCEKIIEHFDTKSETNYSAVRFGNVLGSNGSVVPFFKEQISMGGPVEVTHPEITRFFMTIPEAVALILQSAVYAKGGEIFILDMGEPVKIIDLARKMITLSGYVPDKDIKIKIVGLRPGEKLYEELLLDVSENIKTDNDKIFVEVKKELADIEEFIFKVKESIDKECNAKMKEIVHDLIKTYAIHNGRYDDKLE